MKTPTQTQNNSALIQKFFHFFSGLFFVIALIFAINIIFSSEISPHSLAVETGTVFSGGGLAEGSKIVEKELDETGIIKDGNVKSTVITVIEYFLKFVGVILIVIIIIAAFKLIVSQGEDEELDKAKKTLLYAFIGVVLIVLSYTIVSFITGIAEDTNKNATSGGGGTTTVGGSGGGGSTSSGGSGTVSGGNNGSEDSNNNSSAGDPQSISNTIDKIIEEIKILRDIINEGGEIQESDIESIKNDINDIYTDAPQSEELNGNKQDIDDILLDISTTQAQIDKIKEELKNDPKNQDLLRALEDLEPQQEQLLNDLQSAIEKFNRTISKIPKIRAKISYQYSARTAPVLISLSGDQSFILGKTEGVLAESDYYWYAIGPEGEEIKIGRKMNTTLTIPKNKAGRYTFYLEVSLKDKEGKVISFPGRTQFSFIAKEPKTEVSFSATGGKESGLPIEYTEEENKTGITFVPHVTPKKGRTIELYQWRFDNKTFETREEKAIDFSFTTGGTHAVSLSVIDNAKVKTTVSNRIIIKKAVAYFDLKKYKYKIGEEIFFSGSTSKTTSGYIVEYKWEILDKNNSVVFTSEDEQWSTSFDTPGRYNASLRVTDNKGLEASYLKAFLIESKNPKALFLFKGKKIGYPATVEFDARKSFDYIDSPLTYSWDFDTDGIFEKEDISDPIIEHTYPDAKKYVATLKVKNKFGKESLIQKNISIYSTLTAEISASREVSQTNQSITFSAQSHKGNAFEWNFGDGRTEITEKNEIAHFFTAAGKYKVTLTVHDANNEKTSVTKNIFVSEKDTPIAVPEIYINKKKTEYTENICGAGKNGYEILRSDRLTFSAEESRNRDGNAQNLEYIWNFPENTVFEKPTIQWTFPEISEEGTCQEITLQVRDFHTQKKSPSETLYFSVKNSLPSISRFTVREPKSPISPVSIPLFVEANDEDGKIIKYFWWATQVGDSLEKIGLHSTTDNKTVLIIPRKGEEGDRQQYIFHVEAEDNSRGKTLSDDEIGESESIETQTAVDESPQVKLSQDKKTIKMGDTVVFTAEATDSGNQNINDVVTFKWDFNGDNVFDDINSGSVAQYKYKKFGNFIPRVKVIYKGLATSKEGAVKVEKTEIIPRAAFLYKKTKDDTKNTVQFSSKTSKFDATVSGNALKYEWDFNTSVDSDGDGESNNDIDSTEKNPEFSYDKEFTSAKVLLRVFDSVGGKDTVTHQIRFSEISGIVGSFSGSNDFFTIVDRIWLGENGENGKGLNLQFDEISGAWKNIGDQEFFFNTESKEWVKSFINTNGEKERIAFVFDEDEQKWYDSSDREKPKGLKLVYDEMKRKWVNIGDPAFQFNENTNKWEKLNEDGSVISPEEYENLSSENESWEEMLQRLGEKINESLRIFTSTTSTKLDLYGGEKEMTKGEEFQVFAFVKNLDGSLYEGPVEFSVVKGKGNFSPSLVQSTGGRANTLFTAQSIGSVVIQAKTPDTISHEISETLQYEILDNK